MGKLNFSRLFLLMLLVFGATTARSADGDYYAQDIEEQDDSTPAASTKSCQLNKTHALALGLGTAGLISFIYYANLAVDRAQNLGDDLTLLQDTLAQAKILLAFAIDKCQACIPHQGCLAQ